MLYFYLPLILFIILAIVYYFFIAYLYLPLLFLIILAFIYYFCIWSRTQIFGYFPDSVKTQEKVIALTFDDGPNPPDTERLLEILKKHQVLVTFFTPAKNLEKFPELAKRIIAEGHIIANHSYYHQFIYNFINFSFRKEIIKSQKVIENIIGRRPALYRPPWLFKQPFLLKTLKAQGLTPVSGWFSSNWEIWKAPAKVIAQDALKVVAPGRIIIFHDGFDTKGGQRAGSIHAVDLIIPELKKQGYRFLTVDKLLGVPAYQKT